MPRYILPKPSWETSSLTWSCFQTKRNSLRALICTERFSVECGKQSGYYFGFGFFIRAWLTGLAWFPRSRLVTLSFVKISMCSYEKRLFTKILAFATKFVVTIMKTGFSLEAGCFIRLFFIPCPVLWFQYMRDFLLFYNYNLFLLKHLMNLLTRG